MARRLGLLARFGLILFICATIGTGGLRAAPFAAYVMDARTGQELYARNADTPLHPASLTKMMTLYLAFQDIERGKITLDTEVTVTAESANMPASKLGLRTGQKIRLRYLIRAAAVKSANDCASAIGIALEGSTEAFARRMTRTAQAMGMTHTTFRNTNGLTQAGHLSTAHDMSILGRHVIYDFPQYYNLFSRRSADAGQAEVYNTNRRFLDSYEGADGIKTGFTNAAGFNLVASAQRGNERIIATVFGGRSTADRNAKVAELLDMGFAKVSGNVQVRRPDPAPVFSSAPGSSGSDLVAGADSGLAGKTIRVTGLVRTSLRPHARAPVIEPAMVADSEVVDDAVARALASAAPAAAAPALPSTPPPEVRPSDLTSVEVASSDGATEAAPAAENDAAPVAVLAGADLPAAITPEPRPDNRVIALAAPLEETPSNPAMPEVVTRISTSGGRLWGINVGRYNTHYQAERVLLQVALSEMTTLDGATRRIIQKGGGFDANFMGLSRDGADLACRRLQARGTTCFMIGTEG